ncbi:MAG TPA: nucleoside hydrolase [Ktedonobacteraceae bacterium]|nr:nucleoside hydrolase [Ktedonobacteraceae bacterium]
MRQWPTELDGQADQSLAKKMSVLIDTDIGDDIDDAFALALALQSPELEVRGVTTVFGDTQRRGQLASYLLKVFGREDIPVAAGVGQPIQYRHRPSGVQQAALLDRSIVLPPLSPRSGPELIVETALAQHGQLTLLCLGPLTNVATALQLEPHLFMAIGNIVVMGGSSNMPFPEWNVRSDARAAQIVLGAGIPVTLLGWNVTTRCQLRESDIERLLCTPTPQAQLLSRLLAIWQRHRPRWHPALPYLHDPLTIVALCAPQLLEFREMTGRVISRGPLSGWMVPRVLNGPLVHAAVNVRAEQARAWIMKRLLAPSPAQIS